MSRTKRIIKRTRDRFLGNITSALKELNQKTEILQRDQNLLLNQQENFSIQLSEQIRNSGIIATAQNEILVKLFNGLKIYLDTRDISVVPHIALDGIWEPEITKAWQKLVGEEDTIFDIGANFGYFGLLAAQQTNKKKSKVVFIEANPKLIPYIQKTISLNWYNEQSVIENFAVSDVKGTLTLNVLKDYIGSSSIQTVEQIKKYMDNKMRLELNQRVKVPAVLLDEYCRNKNIRTIDLIKMDIEGYEDIAYAGMRDIIQASPNLTLFIEFTREGYKDPKLFYQQMLKDFGYVYLINREGGLIKPSNTNYEEIIGKADDWVMPVFSKKSDLAK